MRQITRKEWAKTSRNYKTIGKKGSRLVEGQKYIMSLEKEGTALVPVEVIKEGGKKNGI